MTDDKKETEPKDVQAWLISAGRKLLGRDVALLVVVIIALFLGFGKGRDAIAAEVDGGIAPVKEEVARQNAEIERIKEEQAQFRLQVNRRFDEQAADIRALYKAMMTGERQYRLERPPATPDGGP